MLSPHLIQIKNIENFIEKNETALQAMSLSTGNE